MASELETLMAIESSGQLNPAQQSRLQQLRQSGSYGNAEGIIGGPINTGPGFSGSGGGNPFSFDYAAEATKAYGELGAYYDRILKESQGDLNKALARLEEDYTVGKRYRAEQTQQTTQSVQSNALARGLYQKSLADPSGGMGIPDMKLKESLLPIQRSQEQADVSRSRSLVDLPEKQKRNEFELEQQRREKAAALAETRGARAYTDFSARNLV